MHLFLINLLTVLLFQSTSISCIGSRNFNIFSSLPFGPFKIIFKDIQICNASKEYKIQNNFYLGQNPKSNVTEIKGNITVTIPFDDSLFLEGNFARRSADGIWKENTFIHKMPKACSTLRYLMGEEWSRMMYDLGIQNATCPVPPGVYIFPGLDTSIFNKNTNFPKTFIYGTYKLRYFYSRKNEVYGCNIYVVEIKPL
ncbi:PREDICTED: uncharacterized protein LOC107165777 [Diuraphis noxia]|uniref:uncharacterized protein LOC107165777 n=1 Tax=Diuraphis noxia TaxID=143948 RepID=UPI00076397EC|nr:PREDICTED: uncharacterized protein LOC107165777 [Diuraphis noxia]